MDFLTEVPKIGHRKALYILLCFTMVSFCRCTEEYQREIFLGPRNFNPHPYEQQLARIQDPGPVTFPRNEDEENIDINNRYNVITVNKERIKNADTQVYSKVTEKIKYLINRKYTTTSRENQINPEIYSALAEQGSKVLAYPQQELKAYGSSPRLRKKNYAFAYKVLDKGSGDDFSHQQIRNSKTTNGEYRVKLPDGRVQIVSYKADKDGYKADVRYEDDPEFTHQNLIQAADIQNIHRYAQHNLDVQQVPVRQLQQKVRPVVTYDYAAEQDEQQLVSPLRDSNYVVLEQAGPTQIPVKYVDVGVTPSPSPTAYLVGRSGSSEYTAQHYPRVQIYTTNGRDQLQGRYVPSTTAAPYQEKHKIRYTSTPVPPVKAQVNHVGDHGLFIPIRSTFAPAVSQQFPGNYKNVISRPDEQGRIGGGPEHQTLAQENDLPEGIYIIGKSGKRK